MQNQHESRAGSWMQVSSGRAFWPFDPRPEEIDIEDIAHALAHQCRYAGHTSQFYSVAEHSYFLSYHVSIEHALAALMHDSSEAYLVDIPSPLKRYMVDYRQHESALMSILAELFGFEWPLPREVESMDKRILLNERDQFMRRPPMPWFDEDLEPIPELTLYGWNPPEAKRWFIQRFEHLQNLR